LKGGFRAALGEARTFKGSGQAREQPGDDGGHGGVVFGGEVTRLAVDLRRNADGDVFDLAHGAISPRAERFFALLVACAETG
jgi:hypothetical protein